MRDHRYQGFRQIGHKNRNLIFEHEFLIFSAELKLTFLKLYRIQRFWANRISLEEPVFFKLTKSHRNRSSREHQRIFSGAERLV